MARIHRLPVPDVLDEWGSLGSPVTPWQGLVPYDAEPLLVDDLGARGLLVQRQPVRRVQPHCPFCDARLLPLARSVWKVDTEDGTWIIGRDRPWGAPLPIWVCDTCTKQVCVAGLDDLAHRTGQEAFSIDAHRPAIDRLVFSCDACGGTMRRVPEVADAAFETAVVSCSRAPEAGPGDLAVGLPGREGWLDVLHKTVGLLGGERVAYQVVSLPAVQADSSWDPDRPALSDALRWATYAGTTPELAERSFLRPLWQLALALPTQQPPDGELPPDSELLGRWLRARVAKATDVVSHALDNGDLKQATGELASLVDEAVGFCLPGQTDGGASVLDPLSRLLAPFVPHMAEAMHRLTVLRAGDSVHLARWTAGETGGVDDEILALLAGFQHLAACGRLARGRYGVALETKLAAAVVGRLAPQPSDLPGAALGVLARVLNVGQVEVVRNLPPHVGWRLALTSDGAARRAAAAGEIEASLAALDTETASAMVEQLWRGLSVSLDMAGRTVTLLPQEVEAGVEAQPGWAAAGSDGWIVSLQIA
jgi:isoleucyl-tRNA synthetase